MGTRGVYLTDGSYFIGSLGHRAGTRDFCSALVRYSLSNTKSNYYLPAFEIFRSCRTASVLSQTAEFSMSSATPPPLAPVNYQRAKPNC